MHFPLYDFRRTVLVRAGQIGLYISAFVMVLMFPLPVMAQNTLSLVDAQRLAVDRSRQLAGQDAAVAADRNLAISAAQHPEALLIMATLPFALAGGVWFMWALGYNLSVASGVGFIALAGVAAEFGVIMLLYLKNAWSDRLSDGKTGLSDLLDAIREGAVLRVRPKAMTVAVIIAGLLPIMWGSGTGSEIMQRIAAPMVGGMVTAPLLSMFVIPAAYLLMRRSRSPVSRGNASASGAIEG